MPRSPSRTLPRNLKRGGAVAGKSGSFSLPTSATGHLAAAHFRGRQNGKVHAQPEMRNIPAIGMRPTSPEGAGWDEELSNIDPQAVCHTAWGDFGLRPRCPSHSTPLRVQIGMKNCRTSTRKPYTIRCGAISVFAQDAPRTARPLRAQVGMKNRRTSAREAYTIR